MAAPWGPRATKLLSLPSPFLRFKRCQSFLKLFLSLLMAFFLTVGGSVLEFKIEPKRLREGRKNDIEKSRKKRDEQKNIKSDKKSFK